MPDEQNASPMVQQIQLLETRLKELEVWTRAEEDSAHSIMKELENRVKNLEDLNQKCFDANPIAEIEKRFEAIEKQLTAGQFKPQITFANLATMKDYLERIMVLENQIQTVQDNYHGLFHDTAHMEERIKELGKAKPCYLENIIKRHEKELEGLRKENQHLNKIIRDSIGGVCEMPSGKKPHECPVCDGNGEFLSAEQCNACHGKGIVWG